MISHVTIAALLAQAIFAVVTADQLRRHVFPHVRRVGVSPIVTDVWAPIAVIAPMMFFIDRIGTFGTVRGAGWMMVGAPVLCGLIALGCALLVQKRDERIRFDSQAIALWSLAGLVLLLLGAAHDLTMWVGQVALALAAVTLWINTPEEIESDADAPSVRSGVALTVAVAASLAQGAVSLAVEEPFAWISAALIMLTAINVLASAARIAGASAAMRIGGWAMMFGIFIGIGIMSVSRLLPEAIQLAMGGRVERVGRIASGFGDFWLEAVFAVSFAAISLWLGHCPIVWRRIAGIGIITFALVVCGWRLHQEFWCGT